MFGVKSQKLSQAQAGYMELEGAKKDARCAKVNGEVSQELGCCNLFQPAKPGTKRFDCGDCEYVYLGKT